MNLSLSMPKTPIITKDFIFAKLKETEEKEQIKILYAVESGSRGWGFASKDSDFDVRFIYAHSLEWYLSMRDKEDTINYPLSNSLDLSGWDIKKALKLFQNSNPPLYEWLSSPIIYLERGFFTNKLRGLMPRFYSPKSCLHHYLSIAKGNFNAYLTDKKVKTKKYFYVLRPILACMWIEKYQTMSPIEFEKLLRAQELDPKLINAVQQLLEKKRLGKELGQEDKIEIINNFLEEKIAHFENYTKTFKSEKIKADSSLDKLFREIITENPPV